MTHLSYKKKALTAIPSFQIDLHKLKLQIFYFLLKNLKSDHLGSKGCCFHILTCYGYVHEGYASYVFCFVTNEKYSSWKLDLNHLMLCKIMLLDRRQPGPIKLVLLITFGWLAGSLVGTVLKSQSQRIWKTFWFGDIWEKVSKLAQNQTLWYFSQKLL